MRKKFFIAVIFCSILISSTIVIATPKETPNGHLKEKTPFGQWKKEQVFADQKEFVYQVHLRIKERILEKNIIRIAEGKLNEINPIGLFKLIEEYESQLLLEQGQAPEEEQEPEIEE